MTGLFRSRSGEAAYMEAYATTLKLWPMEYEERDVETSYGRVHLLLSGQPDAPPLLMLHATNASATMWFPNIRELGLRFRLIAPDLLGHAGRSVPTRRIASPGDAAAWISETMDAVKVDQAHLLGLSMGAWLALNLAVHAPERVGHIAACSPIGAFVPVSAGLMLRMMTMLALPIRPVYESYIRWVSARGSTLNETLAEQFVQGMQHFRTRNPAFFMPTPFTDEQLTGLPHPILLLLGEEEVMFNHRQALKRAQSLLQDLEVGVIPGAGHMLTLEQPESVNRRLVSFLDWPIRTPS